MMKKRYSLWIMVVLCICLSTLITRSASSGVATKYGYAMFRDATNDQILSDGRGQYIDCNIRGAGGEDQVRININSSDGSLNWVEFYPGRMYYHYPKYPPSTRTVKFNFNVAGSGVTLGYSGNDHEAIHEILRWYKNGTEYIERNSDNPGFLNYGGLHVPMLINMKNKLSSFPFDDAIQFAIEPNVQSPDTDAQAITIPKVDAFYDGDPLLNTSSYFCTAKPVEAEPAPYIVYWVVFDTTNGDGFDVTVVDKDRRGKPISWSIKPKEGANMKLCVGTPNWNGNWSTWNGQWITLATYSGGLSFELIVSLVPIITGQAPAKYNSASATWGKIKGE